MNNHTIWVPGEHHGLVWAGGAALVDGSVPLPTITGLWQRLDAGVDFSGFLQALMAAGEYTVSSLPPFAVVVGQGDKPREGEAREGEAAGSVQVALRGEFAVDHDGRPQASGVGLSTWSEQRLETPSTLMLRGAHGDVDAGAARPVVGGVVPCAALTVAWGDADPDAEVAAAVAVDAVSVEGEPVSVAKSEPDVPASEAPTTQWAAGSAWDDDPADATVVRPVAAPVAPEETAWSAAPAPARATGPDVQTINMHTNRGPGILRTTTGLEKALKGTVVVGRHPQDYGDGIETLRIDAPHLSAEHIEIRVEGSTVYVLDLGSRNGTTLRAADGRVVTVTDEPQRLEIGDVVDLGLGVRVVLDEA